MGRRLCSAKTFKAREGHCRVPDNHVEGTFKLGTWVGVQRKYQDVMPLNGSSVWMPSALFGIARKCIAALMEFKAREGHCRVPRGQVEGTIDLGTWVSHERHKRDTMSAERKQRLDAIEFVWDPDESAWEEGFAALKTFKAREGHCPCREVTSKERSNLECGSGTSARNEKTDVR